MSPTLVKALVALIPTGMLFLGATTLLRARKSLAALLQLLGAGGLLTVVLAHICEALNVFPSLHWGLEHSAGHYLDALAVVCGMALFPTGYLLHTLRKRPA